MNDQKLPTSRLLRLGKLAALGARIALSFDSFEREADRALQGEEPDLHGYQPRSA